MRQVSAALCAAFAAAGFVLVASAQQSAVSSAGRGGRQTYHVARTPWGDPDLEGKWPGTSASGIPLQRAESLGTRDTLDDAEFTDRLKQSERQKDEDLADFDFEHPNVPFGRVGGGQSPPQHWFERSVPKRQASLIVDPPNGRLPAMTPAAQRRVAERRARENSDSSSYTDFTLAERCVTRGLAGSVLPGGYSNGNQIVQSPGYVTFLNEMIHESRIVPLDGRRHPNQAIRSYLGDSQGHWADDTLVVETTNFLDRTGVGINGTGASDALKITERFRRTSDSTLNYSLTIDDPVTWTAPFTIRFDLKRDDHYGMFEYACHEGNYALPNIMSGQRVQEQTR
jgi:hypothetical protein